MRTTLLLAVIALLRSPGSASAEPPTKDAPPPRFATAFDDVLDQTAAVVEGVVESIRYEQFASVPYTAVKLAVVETRLGTPQPSTIVIRQQGGILPNGLGLEIPELPTFAVGKRYVVFLRNTTWQVTPILQRHDARTGHAYEVGASIKAVKAWRSYFDEVRGYLATRGKVVKGRYFDEPMTVQR